MKEPSEHLWYEINGLEGLDSPSLVIYVDRVKKNIAAAIEMVGHTDRLRPHAKTHKSKDVTDLMLRAGITKFKCATIAEAEMLGDAGAPDVLLAYQPIGPKAQRFIALTKRYPSTRYSCLVDNYDAAQFLNDLAIENKVQLSVFIDLNIGMNRTGVMPDERAVELYEKVAKMKGLKPIGLHAYDGHIHDSNFELRKQKSDVAFQHVIDLKNDLQKNGYDDLVIVVGGSPTFPIHATRSGVECSPGTFIYWDAGYQQAYPEQPFEPAALLISRVVSLPGDGLICADLGHKSVAAENLLQRRVQFLNATELELVSQSEEHAVLKNSGEHSFAVGDVLYALPVHICPTCALYERATVVENGEIIGEWKTTARDRKLTV